MANVIVLTCVLKHGLKGVLVQMLSQSAMSANLLRTQAARIVGGTRYVQHGAVHACGMCVACVEFCI